jgi:hypothetical protein
VEDKGEVGGEERAVYIDWGRGEEEFKAGATMVNMSARCGCSGEEESKREGTMVGMSVRRGCPDEDESKGVESIVASLSHK